MLEPGVTLTDYALVGECAVFSLVLRSRLRSGRGGSVTTAFMRLFAALAAASALGGTYHGFFSEAGGTFGARLWLFTLLAIGAVTFFNWLAAAAIQLSPRGQRIVVWGAAAQLLGYGLVATFVSREFLYASVNAVPAMAFLLVGYIRLLSGGQGGRIWLGLGGLAVAFAGAAVQQMGIGVHPVHFNHNAVYHVLQFAAFALIFASVPDLEAARPRGSG